MKKKILLFAMPIWFFACDGVFDYDYFIKNHCDEIIKVEMIDRYNKSSVINIKAHTEEFIWRREWINESSAYKGVIWSYKSITVYRNNIPSRVNYLEKEELWVMEKVSDVLGNVYLTVHPEDFEPE
jgi:hypothetical protein